MSAPERPGIPVSFDLNGDRVDVSVGPAERLLDLLRYRLHHPGTKEGCGEGECGACTVYLDGLPVDSCLVLAHQADGRSVETVEAVDPQVLGSLLASGATQCGACTPGVVMTADWVRRHPGLLDDHSIRELMAGNLCRCTGYDGIVDGVEAMLRGTPGAGSTERSRRAPGRGVAPLPLERAGVIGSGHVLRPDSLEDALSMLSEHPDAVPLAGGTDLLVHWPARLEAHAASYVDLGKLDELRGLTWTDEALVLGGLSTYWEVVRDERAAGELPLLREAGRQVGAVQIQTRGTWAGNIVNASPAADGVPVLMAYDATLTLASASGTVEISLDEFYTGYKEMRIDPGQIITAITIPRRTYDVQWFDKVGSRAAQAITKVGVAVTGSSGDWRVVANSVAPTVTRCSAVERLLAEGGVPDLDAVQAAVDADVSPIDDVRSTADYRGRVLARLVHFGLTRHATEEA